MAIHRTQSYIEALRLQCENECEDILTLHELALQMKERGELSTNNSSCCLDDKDILGGEGEEKVAVAVATSAGGGENTDPQQRVEEHHYLKQSSATTTTVISTSSKLVKSKSTSSSSIQIFITNGPHISQSYILQPKPTQPCFIGRSKGKKFIRNGISLSKDQEVSTTHGKVSVDEEEEEEVVMNENDYGSRRVQYKFYYTDVGSTNGTTVGEHRLEPNVRMEIEEGMEIRVGNSILKFMFD